MALQKAQIQDDRSQRPRRVLLYSPAPKADAGGVQKVVRDLAAHLEAEGHTVVTAWPDGAGSEREWRLDLSADVGPSGRPELFKAASRAMSLTARLVRFRPDVVNIHFPQGQTAYFTMLARLLRYRLVLSFHNSDVRQASPALRAALPGFLEAADGVTAVSSDLADDVAAYRPEDPVQVISNGVDLAFWSDGERTPDPNLAVAAGRLMDMKGFDLLLEAFARGAPPESRLVIAGEGRDRTALEAQAASLGLGDRVSFPGRLGPEALRDLYHHAGLFVLSSRREGMPLALIEAMAAGLPAVATAVNGVPDVMAADTGEMVPEGDVAALADGLGHWIGDVAALEKAGAASQARAGKFSDRAAFAAYEDILCQERHG